MTSMFRGLRRTNKIYNNPNSFITDNANLVTNVPSNGPPGGFQNVLNSPSTVNLGNNQYLPGYQLSNNNFAPSTTVNSAMRNNDVTSLKNIFNVNDAQINNLGQLRRVDNIPDPKLHIANTKKLEIKQNYPDLNTNTPAGVQNALNKHPRLSNHLKNLTVATLAGVGVVLVIKSVNLVQDIMDALNRTGGSYLHTGLDGGDNAQFCILRHRSCGIDPSTIDGEMLCPVDPFYPDASHDSNQLAHLNAICQGYNYEAEQSVCRASDPNADPNSYQYVDISELSVDRTISCMEPYDLADLIGDLGLDWLLDEGGLINQSSNSSQSISNSLLPIIMVIGIVLLIGVIGYVLFKRLTATPVAPAAPAAR